MQISKYKIKLLLYMKKDGLFLVLRRKMRWISIFAKGEFFSQITTTLTLFSRDLYSSYLNNNNNNNIYIYIYIVATKVTTGTANKIKLF